ncbi:MAG TPA: protein-glutamate O-methyltransferase CheR [Vicinamibacterales bacterium]|nr:protein-glutamate O-methyltransferase CheR [Vicinamibacterales bacterium]
MIKPVSGAARVETEVTPQAWHDLILRRCGLTFRHVRMPDVMSLVHDQMRARKIADETAYYQLLSDASGATAEWDALIERLTNHETSFFRHPPSFDALRTHILPALRAAKPPGSRLSLWSAGCSTGQEAYSMAMCAMDDAAAHDFTVWGGDISHHAIKIARQGRYGTRAMAAVPEHYRRRFFTTVTTASGTEYEVVEELRRRVRFMPANLVEADGFRASHDLVMCHNVLIYFSPAAVSRAVSWLASCVAPDGFLLLGPGEAPHDRPAGLEPIVISGVRAFQRRAAKQVEVRA